MGDGHQSIEARINHYRARNRRCRAEANAGKARKWAARQASLIIVWRESISKYDVVLAREAVK